MGIDLIVIVGDVNWNVLCMLNFVEFELYVEVYEWVKKISEYLFFKICVYVEIWFDGEKVEIIEKFVELILGDNYLFCKFKMMVVILL